MQPILKSCLCEYLRVHCRSQQFLKEAFLPSLLAKVQFSEPHGEPDMPIPKTIPAGICLPHCFMQIWAFLPGATWAHCKAPQASGTCSAPCQQSLKKSPRDVWDPCTDDAFPFCGNGLQKSRPSASMHQGSSSQCKHFMIYEGRGRKQTFSVCVHNKPAVWLLAIYKVLLLLLPSTNTK